MNVLILGNGLVLHPKNFYLLLISLRSPIIPVYIRNLVSQKVTSLSVASDRNNPSYMPTFSSMIRPSLFSPLFKGTSMCSFSNNRL